jgi:predicted TIM-barrel fold metal-dependent hydrolase
MMNVVTNLTIPKIISVDDHVVEPPTIWTDRLPQAFLDRAPKVSRRRANLRAGAGKFEPDWDAPDGVWGDWWSYDEKWFPLLRLHAAAHLGGTDNIGEEATTFDEIGDGCWRVHERLADMDLNHVEAAICYPNVLPRFCGQTFLEAKDREFALLCLKAYNDWMIDEWCAGEARGRLIPMTLVPLWDAQLAAAEVRRCADRGSHAVSFSETPPALGLPSVYDKDKYWDPFFQACQETETVINLHIGSSSKLPTTAPDALHVTTAILMFQNTIASVTDYLVSGLFERFPDLRVVWAEGQVGWMPYLLNRIDTIWEENRGEDIGLSLKIRPSDLVQGHVHGCIYNDPIGLMNRDLVGIDSIMFETDFPHIESQYPEGRASAAKMCSEAGMNETEIYKFIRGNAIRVYGMERFGLSA